MAHGHLVGLICHKSQMAIRIRNSMSVGWYGLTWRSTMETLLALDRNTRRSDVASSVYSFRSQLPNLILTSQTTFKCRISASLFFSPRTSAISRTICPPRRYTHDIEPLTPLPISPEVAPPEDVDSWTSCSSPTRYVSLPPLAPIHEAYGRDIAFLVLQLHSRILRTVRKIACTLC